MSDVQSVEEPPTEALTPADVPIHRAICQAKDCGAKVTYRPTATGAGFQVLEYAGVDSEAVFSVGEHGQPSCPRGHGEMTIADDELGSHQVPASDAITQVAGQVNGKLAFQVPDFNFENALHHIIEKRHEVKEQEAKAEKSKDRYKKDKEALDELNVELGAMIDDYEEREQERRYEQERRARGLDGDQDHRLVKCRWEQLNPNEPCPMCSDPVALAQRKTAPGSEEHAIEARDYQQAQQRQAVIQRLAAVQVFLTDDDIQAIDEAHVYGVDKWLGLMEAEGADRARLLTELPEGLGRPHVATALPDYDADEEPSEAAVVQHCGVCGAVVAADGETRRPSGALIGRDCPGPEQEPARQLPKRHKAKVAKKGRRA